MLWIKTFHIVLSTANFCQSGATNRSSHTRRTAWYGTQAVSFHEYFGDPRSAARSVAICAIWYRPRAGQWLDARKAGTCRLGHWLSSQLWCDTAQIRTGCQPPFACFLSLVQRSTCVDAGCNNGLSRYQAFLTKCAEILPVQGEGE